MESLVWLALLLTFALIAASFYLWGRKDGLNYVCHLQHRGIVYECQEKP